MCPTFGAKPRFGTHPMSWAAPGGKVEADFLFDAATTQVLEHLYEQIKSHFYDITAITFTLTGCWKQDTPGCKTWRTSCSKLDYK